MTPKTVMIVIGIFLLFVGGLWGYFGQPGDTRRWLGVHPGWFGLALLFTAQYVN